MYLDIWMLLVKNSKNVKNTERSLTFKIVSGIFITYECVVLRRYEL